MYEPNSYLKELPVQSTELQDLLMCESLFDEFTMENDLNNNDMNTTQSQAAELSDFETQIQAILAANKNDFGGSNDIYNQNFNNFQYSISTPPDSSLFDSSEMLPSISSPDSFLGSPNSYTTFDDNCSLVTPPQIDPLQDFTMSPDDAILQDFGYSSPLDQLLMSKDDLDTLNLATTQQIDTIKKRVDSTFDRDSLSPDRSLKKKRRGPNVGIGKPVKKSSNGPTVPNMMRNNGITQSIIVPSSPAILASNQRAWNRSAQTINPSVTSFASGGIIDQFSNVPLLAARDGSPTPKLPINRLKTTIASSQPQQNSLSQPNKQQKKVAHNAIERRYRNNINNRINELKNVVPALCHLKSKDDEEVEEVDGIPAATKLNKATILGKATEYINHLKNNNQKLKNENDTLRKLIQVIPGGVDLYNTYITEHVQTPPDTDESSSDTSHPNSPHHGSRALMALFMCMTFFTSSSSYITQSHPADHHHHHEGRVMTGSSTPEIDPAKSSFNINDGTLTIDVWYLTRVLTFLMCLTYVLRPSMFSFSSQSHRARKPKSIITSVLNAKTKDARELYQSLSRFSNGLPVNLLEVIIGLISESIKFVLRKFLGRDITGGGHSLIDAEERLTEVALWGRIGEVEMCGGNDKISRLSILYTCLRTINLLESSYTTRKFIYLSYSRIYANAALQCYIGLSSFPFLAEKAASHFWRLANKEKRHGNGMEEKWLKIALNCDQQGEIWKRVVNRIGDHILRKKNEEKSRTELMKHITIPLTLVTDVQALIYLKQTFANFVSTKSNGKKESPSKNQKSFSFAELIRETTPNSLTHWYALVGCSIEEFSLGNNGLGESFVNRLKDYPTIKSDENDYNKQIIAMGLLSYALLMHGKVEASIRCADKVSLSITKRKDQQRDGDGNVGGKMELLDELNSFEMVSMIQDVHDLAEFCVGRIVLEARCLSWKIIEGLISSTNALNETMKSSSEEKENVPTKSSTKTANTTKKSATTLPDVLDSESLQTTIILWIRYLRRLLKNSVFEDIERNREIKKLVILERIVSGDYDDSEDDLEPSNCECEESSNCQHKHKHNDNSRSLNNENENRAIKAWSILKGI